MNDPKTTILCPRGGLGGWPSGGHKVLPDNFNHENFDLEAWVKKQGWVKPFKEEDFYIHIIDTPIKFRSPDTTVY